MAAVLTDTAQPAIPLADLDLGKSLDRAVSPHLVSASLILQSSCPGAGLWRIEMRRAGACLVFG
jgi:hypothetical protein